MVNDMLSSLGFNFSNHNWFGSEIGAYSIIIANIVWGAVPFVALIMYSAFTLVPRDLYEAAAIDGASPATIAFRKVTMPIVRPDLRPADRAVDHLGRQRVQSGLVPDPGQCPTAQRHPPRRLAVHRGVLSPSSTDLAPPPRSS